MGAIDLSGNSVMGEIGKGSKNEFMASPGSFTITPHDGKDLDHITRGIYVGSDAGNVRAIGVDGSDTTYNALPVGTVIPGQFKRVMATGTTSTNLRGMK